MTFAAQYEGRCLCCDERIRVGDEITRSDGDYIHAGCETDERGLLVRPVCQLCFLEVPLVDGSLCEECGA